VRLSRRCDACVLCEGEAASTLTGGVGCHRQLSREFKSLVCLFFWRFFQYFCPKKQRQKQKSILSSSFALTNHTSTHMTLPTAAALEDDANWAVERATALPEFWALVAENGDGLLSVAAA
jgi:hypothetical protein